MISQAINGLRLAWRPLSPPSYILLLPPFSRMCATVHRIVCSLSENRLLFLGTTLFPPPFTLLLVSFHFSSFFLGESKQGVWAGGIRDREVADVQRRDDQLLSLFPLPPCFLRPVIGSFPPPATLYIVQTLTPLTIISPLSPFCLWCEP